MTKKTTFNKKLAAYSALAAAGIASIGAVDAQVVYTDIPDVTFNALDTLRLDIDGDGTNDYRFEMVTFATATNNQAKVSPLVVGNEALGSAGWGSWNWYGLALNLNAPIASTNANWNCPGGNDARSCMFFATSYNGTSNIYGNFATGTDAYLGIRFLISGVSHMGWLRVNCNTTVTSFTLKDYAYEATTATTILAGDMGATSLNNDDLNNINVWSNFNNLNVNFTDVDFSGAVITVFNNVGQVVISEVATSQKTVIDMNEQSAGMYMVQIAVGDNVINKKITIQ